MVNEKADLSMMTSEDRRRVYHHIKEDTDADSDECVRGKAKQKGENLPLLTEELLTL